MEGVKIIPRGNWFLCSSSVGVSGTTGGPGKIVVPDSAMARIGENVVRVIRSPEGKNPWEYEPGDVLLVEKSKRIPWDESLVLVHVDDIYARVVGEQIVVAA